MTDKLSRALAKYDRIVIVGGPKCGKTTAARTVTDRPVLHTDDFMHHAWADQPHIIIGHTLNKPRYLLEGVQTARALRKGLRPDCVVLMDKPVLPRTARQERMAKGIQKVFLDWAKTGPGIDIF